MGVVGLFAWLNKRYNTHIIQKVKKTDVVSNIDNFYIDMNGLLHPCAQKIYKYGEYKPIKSLLRKKIKENYDEIKLRASFFKEVTDTVERLVNIVRPTHNLVLCIDGVAPLSKQYQQRQRRFTSISKKSEEEVKKFDQNSLSPGTFIMHQLSLYLQKWIKYKIKTDILWSKLIITFSDSCVPGEGEHKCIDFMRDCRLKNPSYEKESHCIHGLDADLVMLALATHLEKIYLLRDDIFDRHNDFLLVDVNNLRNLLLQDLTTDYNKKTDAINDFILMCFLLGNDFIPKLPTLNIHEGAIIDLIEIYKEKFNNNLTFYEGNNVKIDFSKLSIFFKLLGENEPFFLTRRKNKFPPNFNDPILDYNSMSKDNGEIIIDFDNWKKDYYNIKFENINVEQCMSSYLEGLQFILSYYCTGVPTFDYVYPYHYSPVAIDMVEITKHYIPPVYRHSDPLLPFEQLLCILPVQSKFLLPKCFWQLFTHVDSPIIDFYPDPSNIKIDVSGKKYEYEGVVKINFVNKQRAIQAHKIIENKYKDRHKYKDDWSRNIVKKNYTYKFTTFKK